jgi:hypothetical protein
MQSNVCALAEALLRNAPTHTLPLWRLHRSLLLQLGTAVGDRATLAAELAAAGNFAVTEPGYPLDAMSAIWDERLRAEYRAALQDMALAETRVALCASPFAAAPQDRDGLDLMAASLLRLSAVTTEPVLADRIAEARAEYGALRSQISVATQSGR